MEISSRSSLSFGKFTAIYYYCKDYLAHHYDSNHESHSERLLHLALACQRQSKRSTTANDIPDELVQRLAPFQSQFSDLFTSLIATRLLGQSTIESFTPASTLTSTSGTYQEILDFPIGRPNSEQIINFKVSEASQSRLQTLLQKIVRLL